MNLSKKQKKWPSQKDLGESLKSKTSGRTRPPLDSRKLTTATRKTVQIRSDLFTIFRIGMCSLFKVAKNTWVVNMCSG